MRAKRGLGVKRSRGIAVAGLCVLAAAMPMGPIAAQPPDSGRYSDVYVPPKKDPTPPPSHEPTHARPHGTGGDTVAGVAVGLGIACLLFCGRHSHAAGPGDPKSDDAPPDRQDLLNNGPHVSDTQPLGMFAVYGLVRNNWPIVVDYDSDPQSATWLTVTVGDKTWTQGLESGRHFVKLEYRGGGADKAAPALFTIESAVRGTRPSQPSRIDIVGVGCGPRAVGSVAINNVQFAPSARQLGGDFARFGYQASSPFNRVDMEILRYSLEKRGDRSVVTVTNVAQFGERAVRPGAYGPRMWTGQDLASGQTSHGLHRLQVRGWEIDGDESWVSAISPTGVEVP